MSKHFTKYLPGILLLLSSFFFSPAIASHLAGGQMAYKYLGDSGVYHRYQVTLTLYQDCLNGQPEAIAQDNPAYFGVYQAATPFSFIRVDSAFYASSVVVPGELVGGPCGTQASTPMCRLKKTFIINYAFPSNSMGYVVTYQRCCRNSSIVNISNPGNVGVTYSCFIPGNINNNSAVFKNLPPDEIALNYPFVFDNSATDADGDSLSYELCSALDDADGNNAKPFPPAPPPFDSAVYNAPYSSGNPIHCSVPLKIDPLTGVITGTPDRTGSYLLTVCCHEWRNGVQINTTSTEFEVTVVSIANGPYKPDAGGNITLVVGNSYQFNAGGATMYNWSPATYLSDPNIPNPVGTFTDVGRFTYTLHGVSDSGCTGNDVIIVTVLSHSSYAVPNAFTPNGDGINDILSPIPIGQSTLISFKVFNRDGNLVYSGGPNDEGWDGRYRGKKQDMNTFYWEVKYNDESGQSHLAKGNVTLIR